MAKPLRRDLRAAIHYRLRQFAGARQPGEPIQSERDLCGMFAVSRTTVRAAIGRLVAEGVLERHQGLGTFVAEPKVQQRLVTLHSFSSGVARAGSRPGARLLRRAVVGASREVAADLAIDEGEPVIYLERLRLVDDRPLLLNHSYFRRDLDVLLTADVEHQSVWDLIETAHVITISRAEQTIEMATLGPNEAKLLGEEPGAAAFHLHTVTFDAADRPVERVHSVYRAATRFYMELRSSNPDALSGAGDVPSRFGLLAGTPEKEGGPA
jgi:GntR family transcriptional regulator